MNLCFQKALKEKEEHIEQLLRERDLERSDVARSAAQVDEVGLIFLFRAPISQLGGRLDHKAPRVCCVLEQDTSSPLLDAG